MPSALKYMKLKPKAKTFSLHQLKSFAKQSEVEKFLNLNYEKY